MKGLILVSIILFSTTQLRAMNFGPVPLEDQLKESDAVIVGKFLGSRFKKLPNNEIITINSFKIRTQAGLKYADLLNRNKIDIYHPGGEWQGIEYKIQGAPEFKDDEESLLFVKRTGFGFRLQNLSLSKYDISYKRDEINFHSVVFKDHPRLGHFNLEELNSLLQDSFNATLEEIPQFSISIQKNNPTRAIASYSEQSEEESLLTEKIPMVGLGLFFILLGISRTKIFWFWRKYLK